MLESRTIYIRSGSPAADQERMERTMPNIRKPIIIVPLAGAVLLGGCATYAPRPSAYSYFAVPCDTPGAIRAVPISPPDGPPGETSAALPAPVPPQAVVPAAPGSAAQAGASDCLIAVADRGRGWRGAGYYGGSYPYRYRSPYGYYGSPFYGSLGIGIGLGGGHYRGGHFGGGHVGGGHIGGGHGRRH